MEQILRKCKCCNVDKELEDFPKSYRKETNKTYYSYRCKECLSKSDSRKKMSEYNKAYRSKNPNKLQEWYKRANSKRTQKRREDINFREKTKEYSKLNARKNKVTSLLYNAKNRALKNNLEFNIDKLDIVIPEFCPILGVKLTPGEKGNYLYTATLDRIDITKGYVKDNIAVISMLANSMKNCATFEQLETFSKNILNYINKDIVRPIEKSIEIENKESL